MAYHIKEKEFYKPINESFESTSEDYFWGQN